MQTNIKMENEEVEILWDFTIETDHVIVQHIGGQTMWS